MKQQPTQPQPAIDPYAFKLFFDFYRWCREQKAAK